jgi:hypothetical protein
MTSCRKRCSACRHSFIPATPAHRFCPRCWTIRRSGVSATWLIGRVGQIGDDLDDAIAIDNMRERPCH